MKSLLHLNKYFKKYKWRLMLGIVFVAISNIFSIIPAQAIRYAFDIVEKNISFYFLFEGFEAQKQFYSVLTKTLLFFAAIALSMAIAKGIFMFFMRQTIIVMSRLIEYDLKNEIFEHYQKLSLAFYKRNNTGDLMNRISDDVSKVRMYLGPAIMYSINLVVLFILVISTMYNVNKELTFYVLTPLPILSVSIYYVSNIINKRSEIVQRQLSKLSSFVQEAFSGIRVIKAYNRQANKEKEFIKLSEEYKDLNLRLVKINALFMPMMILLIGISTILTIYVGGKLTIDGKITTGNIAEFVIYVNMLTWPVASVGWVTSLTQRAAASQKRINEFLNTKPEITNNANSSKFVNGNIEFKNVKFTYPDSGTEALKDVSFKIEKGNSLAIVGKTGSGKSTIANLITRLYDVDQGEITINGINIQNINLNDLRKHIGYVPQEIFLFSETISQNIAFGKLEVENNNQLIEKAAKKAVIHSNINDFPQKYETTVGERGITLSGGQKQRVSIARAIIKEPEILIFDDCLSAVDTETEEAILNNLKELMNGKTTIIISHRISSVMHCDNIIVLENGEIKESGTHQELLNTNGTYKELYNKQLIDENS